MQVRRITDMASEPWRNGGGFTKTVAASPGLWRVSLAEVQRDGPYSRFEGISRISLVLRGRGVALEHGGTVITLQTAEAVEYDGALAWQATLIDGPVTALNVMYPASHHKPRVDVVVSATDVRAGCKAILVALDSGCRLSGPAFAGPCVIDAGHVAIVNDAHQLFTVTPTLKTSTAPGGVQFPVLVTIGPVVAVSQD
jgi:environmental stress-induced protein Ves